MSRHTTYINLTLAGELPPLPPLSSPQPSHIELDILGYYIYVYIQARLAF
jgi:hypothetical protein